MKGIDGATLRRFIPAAAIAAVLALSFMAPSAPLGSSANVAYGYGNNCGVKGYGTHDHGKLCPNRPFPGRGAGIGRLGDTDIPSSDKHQDLTTPGNGNERVRGKGNAIPSATSPASETTDITQSTTRHHHGKGHGWGRINH
jgi:hypothetical protein